MVIVPAGVFRRGSPSREEGRREDEGPVRQVKISTKFAVGVYEVTLDEWRACVEDDGCGGYLINDHDRAGGRRPMTWVSWLDAQSYVAWISRKTGREYRLLSESEWEYVARAGTSTRYSTGDIISTDLANYNGSYQYDNLPMGGYRKQTVKVGTFKPNEFGLYDVHGNVREWVEDCEGSYDEAPNDGSVQREFAGCWRAMRGGSWDDGPRRLRSAHREWHWETVRLSTLGFRVARSLNLDPRSVP